jgi:ABC-type molybdenum transport system ATPase subunit/photorepair protein PhrA
MMTKLGKKVIDNLQLKIKNVHFRFEEKSILKNYSWGITLEEVNF